MVPPVVVEAGAGPVLGTVTPVVGVPILTPVLGVPVVTPDVPVEVFPEPELPVLFDVPPPP